MNKTVKYILKSTVFITIPFLWLLCVSPKATAQSDSISIKLVARVNKGSVDLRWYPTAASLWRLGNQSGYVIERMNLSTTESDNKFQKIATLIPYTENEWRSKTNQDDDFVKAAKEAVLSKPQMPDQKDFNKIMSYNNDENGIFFTLVVATNLSKQAAEGAAMRFTDNNVTVGNDYAYRVYINGDKRSGVKDTAIIFISNTANDSKKNAPIGLRAEEEEGVVKLFWDFQHNRTQFIGYNIERSSDGGRTYSLLNKTPFLFTVKQADEITYIDSVKNYIRYLYRIQGITPFADNSEYSLAIHAMGRDKTPAIPAGNIKATGDRSKIIITWNLIEQSKDLKGFYVARGQSLTGPFVNIHAQILSPSTRQFEDKNPLPKEPYYIVYTIDTANNVSETFAITASIDDNTPPTQPIALRGKIDSSGLAYLTWKGNKDKDLLGYNIYVATGKNNVYYQLNGSPITDTSFTDTVNMRSLDREIYYKITAIDYNNNPSKYSEILELSRPDVIPPSSALITSYYLNERKVHLTWANSSSKDIAITQLRRIDQNGKIDIIYSAKANPDNSFTDSTAMYGESYTYEIAVVDKSGLKSLSSAINITISDEKKPIVEIFRANYNEKEKIAELKWVYTQNGDYNFILFKKIGEGFLKPIITLDKNAHSYIDNDVAAGTNQYAIKVIGASGAESEISKIQTINVREVK